MLSGRGDASLRHPFSAIGKIPAAGSEIARLPDTARPRGQPLLAVIVERSHVTGARATAQLTFVATLTRGVPEPN